MFLKLISICLLLIFKSDVFAQKKKDDTKLITISNSGARDCIFNESGTWLLAENGKLYVLDSNYNIKKTFTFKSQIKAIAKDTFNHIVTAQANGTIIKISDSLDTQILAYSQQIPLDLIITKQNSIILITEKGIYLREDDRLYYENAFTGSLRMIYQYAWKPTCYYIDSEDNLWMGFGAGEWGGNIIVFSTIEKRFINIQERLSARCHLYPVKSFFAINNILYASTSLMHFSIRSRIYQINDSCKEIFESAGYSDTVVNEINGDGIYIGPALYNSADSNIYFYCQYGVYKSRFNERMNDFKNWELVFKPSLKWQNGQADAIGSPMNVQKMFFHKNVLYLVSYDNGLLIWDGKKKFMIR